MDINLLSLSTNPSDHECKDGDLGAMLGVIHEDGALHMIGQPKEQGAVTLRDKDGTAFGYAAKDTRYYIHKVDNDDVEEDDHENCLAVVSGDSGNHVLWCDDLYAGKQAWQEIAAMKGFGVNAVTFTGRVVSLVGTAETRWLMWDGADYQPYVKDDFAFQVRIWSETLGADTYKASFDDIVMPNYVDANGIPMADGDKKADIRGLSKAGMAYFMERTDAAVSAAVENGDNLHKYRSFGFCALRMYDGTYVRVSDIFCIGSKTNTSYLTYNDVGSDRYVSISADLHRHKIAVAMPELERAKNLILGIDVFLCAPSLFYKTGQVHRFTRQPYTSNGSSSTGVQLQPYSKAEMYDVVDSLSFHRVLRIEKSGIGKAIAGAEERYIPSFDETGSVLTLEDFGASAYGATVAHNYNGRTNLGDVCRTVAFRPCDTESGVDYRWDVSYLDTGTDTSCGGVMWNGLCYPVYSKSLSPYRFDTGTAYFTVRYVDGSQRRTVYAMSKVELPLPPVVMLPYPNVESVDMYVGGLQSQDWPDGYCGKYWCRKGMEFHTSATGNWSYVVTMHGNGMVLGNLSLLSPIRYSGTTVKMTGDFEDTEPAEYGAAGNAYADGAKELSVRYRNGIFVSESGNPFAVKSTTQVTVGDGTVLALAAPTQAISQGQAGSTPLVAFTSEGIYPLYVDTSTGLYAATQPGPRDVIIKGDGGYNTEAVVSIDNAILFPTDRGLMMYAGAGTTCLTEALNGKVHDVTLPHMADIFDECGLNNGGEDSLSGYTMGKGLREYLKTCRIGYDYTSQRIWLFQPDDGAFALVYSMRSGAWGMAENNLRQCLNTYPDAVAVTQDGKIVNLYNSDPGEQEFFAVTRPVGFGAPHTLKRVSQSIVRGLFRKGKVQCAVYGSRDLRNWYLLTASKNHCLRGRFGSPYKYFRYLILGKLENGETVEGISADVTESMNNQLR